MKNNRIGAAIAIFAIAMLLSISLFLFNGCDKADKDPTPGEYTVEVKTSGGMILSEVDVSVYADDTMQDLVWRAKTDAEGKTSFKAPTSEGCVIVLSELAEGYVAKESYPIVAGYNEIITETVIRPDTALGELDYKLGDVICDFTLTASDGNEYKVSDLLKEKKAIVLNFWFMNCGPCRMEFPYLQQAYEEYSDDIEVLALNPIDGTDETVSEFANELGLTFPMSACSPEWERCMMLTAYPTTVVIDRYGTISMIHRGSITEKEVFTTIFDFYTSEDYIQTTVRNLSDINK